MNIGYFEDDGPPIPKGQSPAEAEWWNSLSEGHREVIKWWNGEFGQDAHGRNCQLQSFVRSMGITQSMKGPAMHEFAFKHFEEFKTFCKTS